MKKNVKKIQELFKKTVSKTTETTKKLNSNVKYIILMVPVIASYIALIKALIKLAFKPEDYETANKVKVTPKNLAKGYGIGTVAGLYYGLMAIAAEKVFKLGEE